jgi:hypothetical protein
MSIGQINRVALFLRERVTPLFYQNHCLYFPHSALKIEHSQIMSQSSLTALLRSMQQQHHKTAVVGLSLHCLLFLDAITMNIRQRSTFCYPVPDPGDVCVVP